MYFILYKYIYISKGLQCALTAITIVALWQLPHLGRGMCVYTYIYTEKKNTRYAYNFAGVFFCVP